MKAVSFETKKLDNIKNKSLKQPASASPGKDCWMLKTWNLQLAVSLKLYIIYILNNRFE